MSFVELLDIIASNSLINNLCKNNKQLNNFLDNWKKFHNINLIKGNFVSLSHSLNRSLFNSIYQEWNTIIGNTGEIISKYSDNDKEHIKNISEYLQELKNYFDNDANTIY